LKSRGPFPLKIDSGCVFLALRLQESCGARAWLILLRHPCRTLCVLHRIAQGKPNCGQLEYEKLCIVNVNGSGVFYLLCVWYDSPILIGATRAEKTHTSRDARESSPGLNKSGPALWSTENDNQRRVANGGDLSFWGCIQSMVLPVRNPSWTVRLCPLPQRLVVFSGLWSNIGSWQSSTGTTF
jgi:hypothetical protein